MSENHPKESELDARRRRAWTYAVALTSTFVVLGVVFAIMAFPDLHPFRAAVAGACFGGCLAICSITYSAF